MSQPLKIGYHFASLHRLKLLLCKDEIAALGLQISQVPFLLVLMETDRALTQDEISNGLIIDKAATARALDQLEKGGFVTREINPACRRQKLVRVTQKTLDISSKIHQILARSTEVMSEGFTPKELDILLDLMNRMITNAKTEMDLL